MDQLEKLPIGIAVKTTGDIGALIKSYRKSNRITQIDLAEMIASGNRFIIEAESGKPTIQAQKLMDLLAALGLELVIRKKARLGQLTQGFILDECAGQKQRNRAEFAEQVRSGKANAMDASMFHGMATRSFVRMRSDEF